MRSPTYLHDLLVSTLFDEELDADPDLETLGFSAMWIKGADLGALARRCGLDLTTRTPCHLSEILDHQIHDDSRWVAEVGDWICVMPERADGEFLRSMTEGGREALGLSMDMSSASFHYARDGRTVVAFDPFFPDESSRFGDDPHALDHLMDGLRFQISGDDVLDDLVEPPESISSALALIGRVTGTDLAADWFLARHSRYSPAS
ncbi:DUF6461 domain-containing protein [Nonomuraea sp. MCN248]|uniref:DUF6461 domain-containing protein n=1 Tax=Nonomuraea corallina TaxID=2989783 RepID=A0ABT4SKP5_9ACTN|nr:DUF6461 domain-containing protein [Nonomuraea corallina]MDA0637520.1 DUF6461 domain-containing protein [Nonomuraea corallina]